MPIQGLDHFTVNAADLDRSRRFYAEVLGLTDGDRPPFDFPGAWLYCGERPIVHLIGGRAGGEGGTGTLDHIALSARGLAEMVDRLQAMEIAYTSRTVPRAGLHQVFVHDPDGVMVELNFPADEPMPDGV